MAEIKKGDYVRTPRFMNVRIDDVYEDEQTARENGYTEPTYYHWDHQDYDVAGKSLDMYHMVFAAYKK